MFAEQKGAALADLKAIQQLDLNLLKVFESLYLEQNMTRTAERLHITPSAVSHAIKRLRECLQDPLFERSKQKMLPTPACQRMAPLIIDNLSRLRQILQLWGDFEPETSRHHFRIAMHDAIETAILPKLTRYLAKHAPNVTYASIKIERAQLSRELSAGHIDVVLDVAMPIKPPVLHKKLIDDDFSVLISNNHELVNQQKFKGGFSRKDYFSAKHISVSNRPSGAAIEDLLLQEQGLVRKTTIRCQSYQAAREIIRSENLILTLPTSIARRLQDETLQLIKLPFSLASIETHLYWHQNTEEDAALKWFREIFDTMTD